jgi:signal transduction histidine kinase
MRVYALRVRFSDAEIRQSNDLQVLLALGVVGIAFLAAVLTSALGFRYIVGRPLNLLMRAIEDTAATGERHLVDLRAADELGTVIDAFNDLQRREFERRRELATAHGRLRAAHDRLRDSQGELQQLNRSLEARVRSRTEELEQKIVEVEAANRAKSDFLANMSHELRTPLNAVIGFSEIMIFDKADALRPDKYREYAGDIHESGVHLLAVINDILDIAKIESGTRAIFEEDVDIEIVVADCLRLIQERADSSGITLDTDLAAAGAVVCADLRICKQMLINLLSNAVKFTSAGGRVTVASCIDADGDLLLSVADTGMGIAAGDLKRVLEPFIQAETGLARKYQGTGLGLPLVNGFARLHGGTLTLESTPEVGTVATIRLPAERVLQTREETCREAG